MSSVHPYPVLASSSEGDVRRDLALCYRFLSHFGMDDLTYTHASARCPGKEETFFINPFGLLFQEITPESLIQLDFDGNSRGEHPFNKTGYRIHGDIYKQNASVTCIIHLHTIAGVSVSSLRQGLLPLSQFSFHFFERLKSFPYDGLTLEKRQGHEIGYLLKDAPETIGVLLQNHGTLVVGTTIQEAFFYAYYLEKACQTQVAILSQGKDLCLPSDETCRKARDQMRAFETHLGQRDWAALKRVIV